VLLYTPPKNKLLCKKIGVQVSMELSSNKLSTPMAIENIIVLGAVLELIAKQHCQSSPFTLKMGQIGGVV
jgi:hypothetical protein